MRLNTSTRRRPSVPVAGGGVVFYDWRCGKAAGATRRLFPGDTSAELGPMVPMVAGPDPPGGDWLLLRRQVGVERLERSKKTGIVVGAQFRELLAQLESLYRVYGVALLTGGGDRLVQRFGILAHCCRDRLPLRLLRRRDLELGLHERDAPFDKLSGHPPFHCVMALLVRRCSGIRRPRRGLGQSGNQSNRCNAGNECRGEE